MSSFGDVEDGEGPETEREGLSDVDEDEGDEDLAGDEYVDGDGEGEENDEYQLEFGTGMDPLAFVEENESGVMPFQQFEKLEYEALAARKRKALAVQRAAKMKSSKAQEDVFGANIDEIWESAGFGIGRRRRRRKKKRKLGRRSRLTPEVAKMLGEANLLYAMGKFEEAVELLKECVRIAPNVPDSYHTLGLLYDAMSDRKKALNFYMIAAHLTPKDSVLWKRLASWSMEQGNIGQVIYCLTKAVKADPDDVDAKWDRASLFAEHNDYQKAAEAFEQLLLQRPSDVEVGKMVAKMHHKTGQCERAIQVLEKLVEEHPAEADLTAVNLLAELLMESGQFATAIAHIDHASTLYCPDQHLPIDLSTKAGICHAYLGNLEDAESFFEELSEERIEGFADLIMDVGDAYLALGEHKYALHYYGMLHGDKTFDNAGVCLKMAECHAALKETRAAIDLYYRVLQDLPHHIETRLTLATILDENGQFDEAISVLAPPESSESVGPPGDVEDSWWKDGEVRKKLAQLYLSHELYPQYLDTLVPAIQETLYLESQNHKVRNPKRLRKSVLLERVRWIEDRPADEVFHGFRPVLSSSNMVKAARAKKRLQQLLEDKKDRKAAALAAGQTYESEEEEDDEPIPNEVHHVKQPLPNLLKDEEHYQLILQCCRTLTSSKRYWEALEIVHHTLQAGSGLGQEKRDELRNLGARIAYQTRDANYGFDCVKYMVAQRPYSTSVWNRYYQVISRSEARVPKHNKFMLHMRSKYPDVVPTMIISGHQFSMISQQQGALREYLQAYKLQPEDPFINLCVGTAFINLSLGFRLSNRNQCVMQGFAFLYKYQRLVNFNQESNFNLARAYHHVGLVQLASTYYEKVLSTYVKDRPPVKLPHEAVEIETGIPPKKVTSDHDLGHCNLQREAAYNLHLIYKRSGSSNLARQLLKDYCSF
ncbi:general transcription factor 3C polypeptide 3 (transcription factor C subunit 4) [Marchantia polymorpha subsp. ruderalis]|uniref:General transcription factor 3C polypeptide 3 n=4 Tax=Marchantia polymorpha TaxID=3197 RepID=A0AAF6B3X7_MARPO|nr:hypothetical protein MARPO_0024s0108 [Marchantia polymorpha]BBN06711.1 hypothetical protein Mp_3g23320 [Marchantia polymorpha subsp. ruderalis]|eukprot:PTQ43610.1 hypothetical protein MARPO_0024s0108 [Marchantia polymorpha]